MSERPQKAYQVYDSTDTDDLVLWKQLDQPYGDTCELALRQRVTKCLPQATCFAGPVNFQVTFDPLAEEAVELPVHYHFKLDPRSQLTFFLYITKTTIELHLPELWFVTGILAKDAVRLKAIRNLKSQLSEAFGIEWEDAEFGGTHIKMRNNDDFWNTFLNNLFARINFEEIDDEGTAC